MSPRTLIVGVLAAVCGVCATAGVMTWTGSRNGNLPSQKIVTAKIGIELGAKIETNMLKIVDWPSDKIPSGALTSADQVVGKYCIYPIFQGQPLLTAQLDDEPTTLQPDSGFFAVAIDTDTESSSLGKNLTDTVVTRSEATLVTNGPYRWVRHPFYVTAALLMASVTLLSANWLIGLSSFVVMALLIARTPNEERKLIEKFGDEYRKYIATTGRFIPRIGK